MGGDLVLIKITSRQGWVRFEPTRILSVIQFTKRFSEFFFVETHQFFGSNSKLILMWEACGQRSSMVVGSKRIALAYPCEFAVSDKARKVSR